MFKNYADINSDIHDDVEPTAEAVAPAEDGFGFFAEPYGVTKIPMMSDEVAALCMLSRALATALNTGVMTQEDVDLVVTRVAKTAARRDR